MLARREQWRPLLQSGAALDRSGIGDRRGAGEMLDEELASAPQTLDAGLAGAMDAAGALCRGATWGRTRSPTGTVPLSARSDRAAALARAGRLPADAGGHPAQDGQREERLPRRQGIQGAEGRHACRAGGLDADAVAALVRLRRCRRRSTRTTPSCAPWCT
jgi:hypothetical protein